MRKDPIKLIIGLGFTGVLALMGLISFISLSQMHELIDRMGALQLETKAKISASNAMRDSVRLRGETLYQMYLTEDYIERDSLRLKFGEYGLIYKAARDKLSAYHLSAREAKLLDSLVKQTRIGKALNDEASQNLLSDLPKSVIQNDLEKVKAIRTQLLNNLDNLVHLQEEIAESKIKETNQYQENISKIILFLSLAAFFIAVYIAQLVMRETSKKNSEIHFQATHDELTKLANRKEFNHRLDEAYNKTKENNENHALCFLDLDKFKVINDTCGHNAGDELLIKLTKLIANKIRSHDTLARLGGDEFGLLLEGCSLEKAIEISEGIVNLVKNYEFNWHDKKFHVGVSIGLVMITDGTKSVDLALTQADTACYAAKDMGRNQVHVHGLNDGNAKKMQQELGWVASINDTDKNDHRFSIYLQAIEDLQTNDACTKYEVLLRLNDDQGTVISPKNYLSAAERFNLMKGVDYWVIEKAFEHIAELYRQADDCDVRLFINISANSLTNAAFVEFVTRLYKQYHIADNAICFEISEIKAIKNINHAFDIIKSLKELTIKFAVDDFGAGLSSFSYLRNLPVDYIKIDGELVKNISHSTADKAMVAAINQLAKVMNIKTIAEHVENIFTMNQLKDMGIDYAQGFYLDKPEHIDKRIQKITQTKKHRLTK